MAKNRYIPMVGAIILALLVPSAIFMLWGCKSPDSSQLDVEFMLSPASTRPDCIWAITSGSEDSRKIRIYNVEAGELLGEYDREDVISVWADGMLTMDEGNIHWNDFSDAVQSSAVDNFEISGWDSPVGMNPDLGAVYVLAHSTPPLRSIQSRYLNGNPDYEFGQFVAEEVIFPRIVPSNGWSVITVDRPGQAGAVTPDLFVKTKKVRLYDGEKFVGEYDDVEDVYYVRDGIIIKTADGWSLFDKSAGPEVNRRRLSFNQIEGEHIPLARWDDKILVAIKDTGGLYKIYEYGMFSREFDLKLEPGAETTGLYNGGYMNGDSFVFVSGEGTPEGKVTLVLHYMDYNGQVNDTPVRANVSSEVFESYVFTR
ncbi:MAG TPA: hypothetical protein VGB30_09255 [bacterium]|jgi:hypothetical protein